MNVPELYKEKLFFGEITDKELLYLQNAGFSADRQKKYIAETANADKEFLKAHPMKDILSQPRSNTADKKKLLLPFLRTLPLVCAGAVCTILAGVFFFQTGNNNAIMQNICADAGSGERIKGAEPRLFVYKKSAGIEALLLRNKSLVHENDVLQVSYVSGGAQYGAIISVDGNGVFTQHFPDTGKTAGKLTGSGETILDSAYRLDDAPAFERFIFISGNKAVSIDKLRKAFSAAQGADSLLTLDPAAYLPKDCRVTEMILIKDR